MKDKICLLITTFNRGHLLKNSLERLTNLTLPDEVLVVSDGCSDNTEEVCKSFKGRLPIRYIYNHNPDWSICSYARNIGIKNTDCDVIITSEPEILFITDVVKQMIEAHESSGKLISAGTIFHQGKLNSFHPDMITNPHDRLWMEDVIESKDNPFSGNPSGYTKVTGWQATYVALYRRSWLIDVGGWDEQFPYPYGVDDIDLCTRVRIRLGINQDINLNIYALHQYHDRPSSMLKNAVEGNVKYFDSKRLSVDGHEDVFNPNLIANQNKEWGVIIPRN